MILADSDATQSLGFALAAHLRPGDVVALSGNLGAGKSTLARGILAGLGHEGGVPSPTFPLVIPYEPPDLRLPVWHVDLYRLEQGDGAVELGLDDALIEGVMLIEWPDRLGDGLWRRSLILRLDVEEDGTRALTATVPPSWASRWPP